MKKGIQFLTLLIILISCVNDTDDIEINQNQDYIYQYSSKNGLLNNDYIGDLTIEAIKRNGEFGLGTFNMVDGEMVIFDGNVYQVLTTGEINNITSEALSPFVLTKFFNSDTSFSLPNNISLDSAQTLISEVVENLDLPLAIKMEGTFKTLLCRSVQKVTDESVTLEEIIADQTKFNFSNIEGTVIGFWYPQYFDGVNFPGFHLHVLLDDLSGGGHLLDCTFESVIVEIDYASGVDVAL